jgi:hypothetical protein
MKLGHKGHLNTMNKFPKEVFPKSKILDKLEELGFAGTRRNSPNQRG